MMKLGSPKGIGTPVRCPSCRHPNLAIDIWCERCGTPLDWQRNDLTPSQMEPESDPLAPPPPPDAPPYVAPILTPARQGAPRSPRWTFPNLTAPALKMPELPLRQWQAFASRVRASMSSARLPAVPRTVGIVAIVVAVLLLVPLAYLLIPAGRPVAVRQTATHLAVTNGSAAPDSPQAVAIAGVQAKTGIRYGSKCSGGAPCLSISGQTMGEEAAAIVFSTAATGGRECAAYVDRNGGKWRLLGTECGLPGQVTPLVGRNATVHVPGNCANVRDTASLQASVAICLYDGTTVKVDRGPVYADGLMWWHISKGWMAHDFLVGP